jgi:hypothetical protein
MLQNCAMPHVSKKIHIVRIVEQYVLNALIIAFIGASLSLTTPGLNCFP